MNAITPSPPQRLPRIRYVGDLETGLVHGCSTDCEVTVSQIFLDLRTALVRGYQLCSCCRREQEPARSHTVASDFSFGPAVLST